MKTTALRHLKEQLETLLEEQGEETTLRQAVTLLTIALHEGQTVTELADTMGGPSYAMVSRTVDLLSNWKGRSKTRKPAGLVERRPIDRVRNGVHLTRKGKALMEALA